ncbi:porin family protein [Neolewinella antarctica]|uniref:Outer membrane protein beta-barrel domain-containing protein n=1 Tax=Neolewinella antarctica TaxID=442734 RepID=A0ABX0XGF2_9BACT|nr:porin family protein [Neolewinella antarctica]NJC27958.1 hypothetical protein [Neolewinella antarctica]
MLKTLLLVVLSATALTAQRDSSDVRRLEVGVGFGVLDHNVDFTPAVSDVAIRGNNYGLVLRYFDNRLVGFQAELSYVEAGWREDLEDPATGENFATQYARSTEYVELMMLTQFSVGRGAVQPLLQAGPYLSVPVGESEDIPAGYVRPETTPEVIYGYEIPFRLNYGVQIGAGLNVRLGPVTVQAEGRYLIGFNDLVRTGETRAAISRRVGYGARVGVLYALWR